MQTNAFHVIKDLPRTERLPRYDVPSGLVAYAAQCSKKPTTQISRGGSRRMRLRVARTYVRATRNAVNQLVRHEGANSQPESRPSQPSQSTFSPYPPYLPPSHAELVERLQSQCHSIPFRKSRGWGNGRGEKALHRPAALAYHLGRWHSISPGPIEPLCTLAPWLVKSAPFG